MEWYQWEVIWLELTACKVHECTDDSLASWCTSRDVSNSSPQQVEGLLGENHNCFNSYSDSRRIPWSPSKLGEGPDQENCRISPWKTYTTVTRRLVCMASKIHRESGCTHMIQNQKSIAGRCPVIMRMNYREVRDSRHKYRSKVRAAKKQSLGRQAGEKKKRKWWKDRVIRPAQTSPGDNTDVFLLQTN
jgi:hypothetical protein